MQKYTIDTDIGEFPADWMISTIKNIKSKKQYSIAMGPFGSNITKDNFIPSGIPVIRGTNLEDFKFKEEDFVYLSETKADELKASNAFPKDIVITHRGTLGQVGIIPENSNYSRYVVSQSQMKLSCDENIVNPYFVYYFLKSKRGQHLLLLNKSQTGVPAIARPTTSLKGIKLPLPNLEEQNAIVDILKSLDDKIELNRRMNATLEQIAQAIFKQWFIDFEFPDENGQPYKSSGGEMVESELGEIPRGWRVGKLGEIIDIFDSKRIPLSKKERTKRQGEYPYYGASSIMDYVDDYIFDGIYLLMGEDGTVIDEKGYPILQYVWGKFWVNNHAHVIAGKYPFFSEYLYLFLKTKKIKHIVTGAVQLKINQKNLKNLRVLIPSEEVLIFFKEITDSLFSMYRNCDEENKRLMQVRDTFLPKLMSGKIRMQL